jgi:antitoxin (DNA-binding transcriptional repressor) of toxin-antitoxin stability system
VRESEITIREQAGEASVLTVDGEPVAKRLVFDAAVKTHTRHMDYYRRIKQAGDDDG